LDDTAVDTGEKPVTVTTTTGGPPDVAAALSDVTAGAASDEDAEVTKVMKPDDVGDAEETAATMGEVDALESTDDDDGKDELENTADDDVGVAGVTD